MPIRSAINDLVPDAQTWRREIHQNPGLMYDVETTAGVCRRPAARLRLR